MARILVVDDDHQLRSFLREVLKSKGHVVEEAADGGEGLEAYRREPADLVLCDIIMPQKEGLETIRELVKSFPGAKIIAMSGGIARSSLDPLTMAARFGSLRCLYKPFSIDALVAAVDDVLQSSDERPAKGP